MTETRTRGKDGDKLNIGSLGAQHPDLMASKTLELMNQRATGVEYALSSSTSAPG